MILIGEVASNHGGSLARVQEFAARFSPYVNYLKFQLTRSAFLSPADPQYEWFQRAELNIPEARAVVAICKDFKVKPLFTINRPDTLEDVKRIGLTEVKIGSGEAHSGKLAEAVLAYPFERIFVSEGILPAHNLYARDDRVILLAAVSRYPAPIGSAYPRLVTGRYRGFSDHSIGINEAQLAIHMGIEYIEKHLQLRSQARPPQSWEATVEEIAALREWSTKDPQRFIGRWGS